MKITEKTKKLLLAARAALTKAALTRAALTRVALTTARATATRKTLATAARKTRTTVLTALTALTALTILTAITTLSTAQANSYYVNIEGHIASTNDLEATVTAARENAGTDTIYVGYGVYKLNAELVITDLLIGGCSLDGSGYIVWVYPGVVNNSSSMQTILDGNSFVRVMPSLKHRVATVKPGGTIAGCVIRNGHARGTTNDPTDMTGFGGGVLVDGGKLLRCIIRGNVAMNMAYSTTNPSKGGGAFITGNGGDIVNCIIAFNMDDRGMGVDGNAGSIINNTISRNANTPKYAMITGNQNSTPYQHFGTALGSGVTGPFIRLNDFYMATTETTQGQYACFLAAMDITLTNAVKDPADWQGMLNANTPMYGYATIAIHKYLGMTAEEQATPPVLFSVHTIDGYYMGANGSFADSRVFYPNKVGTALYAAGTRGEVNYPADPLIRDNFPMSNVTWYGSLAFCAWLGTMLPTEAQWEYAARKTPSGLVTNSSLYAGGIASADEAGWYSSTGHEVALLLPTGTGLYDINGSVFEWCADWYVAYPTGASVINTATAVAGRYTVNGGQGSAGASASSPIYNPIYNVVDGSSYRVCRGGGWGITVSYFALGWRSDGFGNNLRPSYSYSYWGFRSVACVACP